MIHYQLRCDAGHAFDGWFKDSAGFDRQAQAGLVACPECGDTAVQRGLMAPAIPRKGRKTIDQTGSDQMGSDQTGIDQTGIDQTGSGRSGPRADTGAASGAGAGTSGAPAKLAVMPDGVRALLQKLRAEVEKHCEPVGDRFAEEARAIHRGESQARGIYGEATPEQAEALADEGIEVARIPWVPRSDG